MKTDKQVNNFIATILTGKFKEWERKGLPTHKLSNTVIGFGGAMFRYGFISRNELFKAFEGYLEYLQQEGE